MRFGELIKHARADNSIGKRHDAWLENNSNPVYSEEALQHGARELLKQATPRDRRGSVSASSLGKCIRKQQFTFLGLPELNPNAKTAQIFQTGTFMHIRWQMAGITEGWLAQVEVPVGANPYKLSGTIDGISEDGRLVEFKSINTNGFQRIQTFGATHDHQFQLGTYLLAMGRTEGVFIYENKDNQEYKEIDYRLDPDTHQEVLIRVNLVWEWIERQELAPVLDKCWDQEGYVYTGCPFRDRCLTIRAWEEAEQLKRSA